MLGIMNKYHLKISLEDCEGQSTGKAEVCIARDLWKIYKKLNWAYDKWLKTVW
jgi:hypothetical protein